MQNMINKKSSVIQKSKSLFYNSFLDEFACLDSKIAQEFKEVALLQIRPKDGIKIVKLLNIYFYIYDVNLKYLSFKNSSNKELLTNFLQFCCSDYLGYTLKYKQLIRNYLTRMLKQLNLKRAVKLEIDTATLNFDYKLDTQNLHNKLKVIHGYVFDKNEIGTLLLFKYGFNLGLNKAVSIYEQIEKNSKHIKINTQTILVLNKLIDYCILIKKDLFEISSEDLGQFAKIFFNDLNDRKINISQYKQSWNDFIELFSDCFTPVSKELFKIKTQRINGNTSNIKIKNHKKIKDKLITEVPLEISDEKSIHVLKYKVNQDIAIIKKWSESILNDYISQQTIGNYPTDDFFLEDIVKLQTKYKMWREGSPKKWLDKNINKKAIFNKTHAFASCCLLIIYNPAITDQFLKELTQSSVVKTDQGIYLVGKKHRKGKEFSEQKILLTKEAEKIVDLLLTNSIKMGKIVNSDKLFLHVNENSFLHIVDSSLRIEKDSPTYKNLVEFLIKNYSSKPNHVQEFISKITFTKLRASCAIQSFFEHQSTKKMAEILGHENYNPSLLTHYLPEPIIHFYQSRWIRTFQKGIIYEAMKDSQFLLKAIGFKDMETLNKFLSNHVLKNLPSSNPIEKTENVDECYVSINEENLTALFSIKEAVKEATNKSTINEKALFWSDFAEKLESEIINNKTYYSFNKVLKVALSKAEPNNFKEVIYA
jgi:hypothetical protein